MYLKILQRAGARVRPKGVRSRPQASVAHATRIANNKSWLRMYRSFDELNALTRRKLTGSLERKVDIPLSKTQFIHKLRFNRPDEAELIPVYTVMDKKGNMSAESENPELDQATVVKMYRKMILIKVTDDILTSKQKEGQIPFYMTSFGENATHIGSAAALSPDDMIYGYHRDIGVLLWRGFGIDQFINHCYGNCRDNTKGRQMATSFGSRDHNFVTVSPPLGTQMPQAGTAYAMKRAGRNNCVVCYFGDGTASTADAHAAFSFATTLECPVIFFCRNNGYATSMPTKEIYKGDAVASFGHGYGMLTCRVDGNDVFAVYNATKAARLLCLKECRPVLIEAMTYRIGDHTSNVDSSRFRSDDEVRYWEKHNNPLDRLRYFMLQNGWWSEDFEEKCKEETNELVMDAVLRASELKKPSPDLLFTDVYKNMEWNIAKQHREMKEHVYKYVDQYPLDEFETMSD